MMFISSAMGRTTARLRAAVALAAAALVLAAGMSGASAAQAAPVNITFSGNPCYLPFTSLTKWAVAVDTAGTFWGGSGRTITANLSPGSHRFTIQSWCGPFAGRGASGSRWIYSTGTSYASFWAGVFS